MQGLKLKVKDRKHNAYALFQLGYSADKLFAIPLVLECVAFEVYQKDIGFSFDEEPDNYELIMRSSGDSF